MNAEIEAKIVEILAGHRPDDIFTQHDIIRYILRRLEVKYHLECSHEPVFRRLIVLINYYETSLTNLHEQLAVLKPNPTENYQFSIVDTQKLSNRLLTLYGQMEEVTAALGEIRDHLLDGRL